MAKMRLVHLLPRLLLTICLILNGVGAVMASVDMKAAHLPTEGVAPSAATAHAHSTMPLPEHALVGVDPCAERDPDDCCSPDHCDGACTQVMTAVVLFPRFLSPLVLGGQPAGRPMTTRPDPVLTQPVRPPIA